MTRAKHAYDYRKSAGHQLAMAQRELSWPECLRAEVDKVTLHRKVGWQCHIDPDATHHIARSFVRDHPLIWC